MSFGKGIPISAGFDLGTATPIDSRYYVNTRQDMFDLISNPYLYKGMHIFVIEDLMSYIFTGSPGVNADKIKWFPLATKIISGTTDPDNNEDIKDSNVYAGSMYYVNTVSGDMFERVVNGTGVCSWQVLANFKGIKGDKGDKGNTGTRGSIWNTGDKITGTETTPTAYATGISSSLVNDLYFNPSSCNVYRCTVSGNEAAALWAYVGTIRGDKGDKGEDGIDGERGSLWWTGRDINGTGESITSPNNMPGLKISDIYLNSYTGNTYKCINITEAQITWEYINNIIGNSYRIWIDNATSFLSLGTIDENTMIYTLILSNPENYISGKNKISPGDVVYDPKTYQYMIFDEVVYETDTRAVITINIGEGKPFIFYDGGVRLHTGTLVNDTNYSSGVSYVAFMYDFINNEDLYINTDIGSMYKCIEANISGNNTGNNTAKFEKVCDLKGRSAYEIAVKNGYTGTEVQWLDTLKPTYTYLDITIPVANWQLVSGETDKYTQTITVSYDFTDKTDITVIPTSTYENIRAISDSFVIASEQRNDTDQIVFLANEGRPTIDITYILRIQKNP